MATIPPEKAPKPGLNIYGCAAVNPVKLTIAAEELGFPYTYFLLDMAAGELSAEWFKAINPNGKAPAIVHVKEDGTTVKIFEIAACLLYLASEFDKAHKLSFEVGTPEYWTQLSRLSWQVGGYGPMMGQANHFNLYAAEAVPYGKWRFTAEARRLNHVLDVHLSTSEFVAGNRLTVADIAIFMFAHSIRWCGLDVNEYPHVKSWVDKLFERPAFQKGLRAGVQNQFSDAAFMPPESQDFYNIIRKYGTQSIKRAKEHWEGEAVPVPSDHENLEGKQI